MKCSTRKSFLTSALALTLGIVFYVGTTPAIADIYKPANGYDLSSEMCMADAWMYLTGRGLPHDEINCTANDVEITEVIPRSNGVLPGEPGYEPLECVPGQPFQFYADIKVRTNANERYNTTFYVPLTETSPQYVQGPGDNCSLLLPIPDDEPGQLADVDLDGDMCGDISKAFGPDEYTLTDEPIKMFCTPSPDDPTRAEFNYCAAWSVDDDGGCTPNDDPIPGIVPSQKSKCKCDSWPIDVFIKPDPPELVKTIVGTNTHPEFGGEYTFNLTFTNPSDVASLFLQSLSDEIKFTTDSGNWEVSLNLWADPVGSVPAADGVYLTASNCEKPGSGETSVEILPSDTYSCQFSVHIVDGTLPGLTAPEIYDDAVKAMFVDKNDTPVVDGNSCEAIGLLPQEAGEHCSNTTRVYVTNVMPVIGVTKVADPNSLTEPGGFVTYTVAVTNYSALEALELTSLVDVPFGSLNGMGNCSLPQTIAVGGTYSCEFTYLFDGLNTGDDQVDTVTAIGEDNEGNTDDAWATATVSITDSPSAIVLIKDADKTVISEPGEWVTYNFTVSNQSAVDTVWIDTLRDSIYGNLTEAPTGGWTTCGVGFPFEIQALSGTVYYCEYYVFVAGDAADDPAYTYNIATAEGYDDDPIPNRLTDDDDHNINYIDVPPVASLTKEVTQMVVTYEVVVTNDSTAESLYVDALVDNTFGDITFVHDAIQGTNCVASGQEIGIGGSYTCQFSALVTESPHLDTVTGTVSDNEENEVYPSDQAIVTFGNP